MRKYIAAFLLLTTAAAFAGQASDAGLVVRHLAPAGKIPRHAPYAHMWYYRTEVFNSTQRPLRVIWFQAYTKRDGQWVGVNVLGRTLRSKDFSAWYTEGDPVVNGVIGPGKTAACDVNWTGTTGPGFAPTRWAFIAVDDSGNDYYAEATVDRSIVKHVHHRAHRQGGSVPMRQHSPAL